MRFKTLMLRLGLCDYSNAYIVVKGRISVSGTNAANRRNRKLTFKSNAPFRSCISKICKTFIENAEGLDIVMPMYNLLQYSDNNYMTSGSLWNYYRDEVNDNANKSNVDGNYRISNNKARASKYFEYETKIIANTPDNSKLDTEIVILLKYIFF